MKTFYVYQYIRAVNGKHGLAGSPYYVGKGSGRRAWSRRHFSKPPSDPKQIEIVCDGMNEMDALQLEMFLIHLHGRIDRETGCLWNRTDGGELTPAFRGNTSGMKGKKHSPESRATMAAAKLGRKTGPHSAEWSANIAAGNRGKKRSAEYCARMSAALKGKPKQPRSAEHCEAIRQAKLGRKRPDMVSGSPICMKSAATRTGQKRGKYNPRRPQ